MTQNIACGDTTAIKNAIEGFIFYVVACMYVCMYTCVLLMHSVKMA